MLKKPRVTRNAEIIQSFSIVWLWWKYIWTTTDSVVIVCIIQRELTQVNCLWTIVQIKFSQNSKKMLYTVSSVENPEFHYINILFSKQHQSKKYIFLAKFLHLYVHIFI
jgi:hypothetical protein